MSTQIQSEWLRERGASAYSGLSVPLLRKRRQLRLEPQFSKVGRAVLYSKRDLDALLEKGRVPVGGAR